MPLPSWASLPPPTPPGCHRTQQGCSIFQIPFLWSSHQLPSALIPWAFIYGSETPSPHESMTDLDPLILRCHDWLFTFLSSASLSLLIEKYSLLWVTPGPLSSQASPSFSPLHQLCPRILRHCLSQVHEEGSSQSPTLREHLSTSLGIMERIRKMMIFT